MMDLDMALREDEPSKLTNESTEAMRAHYAKWERSNRLSLISIKRSIPEHLLEGILEINNAKEFLVVANRYQTSDNAEVGHFMDELMNMSPQYIAIFFQPNQDRIQHPNQSWGVNDLITKMNLLIRCSWKPNNQKIVEKARKPNFHSHKKNKNFKKSGSEKRKNGNAKNTDLKCYHATKGSQEDSWWLDSGATIHVATSLQGIRNLRKPSEKESKLKVGSDIGIDVEHIGIAVLELDSEITRKVIKIMRSDRGGEYYGKHGDLGQQRDLCKSEQNGVVERRNHTLMEMKRSMTSRSNLPEYLWGETNKIATYIMNRVPSKFVPKTPFELWTGRKPSLNHFKVWGCLAVVKIYDPSLKKTDSRTTRCYFIGYPSHSKGYKFYCLPRGTRVVESQVAKFLELDVTDSIPSQSDERVEPMDVISLPLLVSNVNLDVGAFDSGIQQGVAINFPTVEINPIVDEIHLVEMRRSQRTRRPTCLI
ncbi:hypothetical protein AAG906_022941 [Vitis piasezkii]